MHFLVLKNAAKHKGLLQAPLEDAIAALAKKKILSTTEAKALGDAHSDAQAVQAFLRLTAELPFDPKKASQGLKTALTRAIGKDDFKALAARLEKSFKAGYAAYLKILS